MPNATVHTDSAYPVGPVNPRLFGSFVEHLGRCVYDGIYEPGHPNANEAGFRTDVIDLVRELGVTAIRYPGGNFVSGFRWEDSVGPKADRPRRPDLAWHSTETNQVGIDEFARWAKTVGSEVVYAINLGTRGVLAALDVLEYANLNAGTSLSELRVQNGSPEPHDIRMWCLGNEMDGPWQLGHTTAVEYGRLASQVAKAMRQLDPNLELVVCGSSNSQMPTFGTWEREVLTETFDDVDYISCHAYYEELDGDSATFLAAAVDMDRFIDSVVAQADAVAASRKSRKQINISFDEWNVWYQRRFEVEDQITDPTSWPVAPRLLEDSYSVLDAVVVGSLLISLLNHADRVHAAALAQLVNVIAPIMTEPGGPTWRQTTFYPFALTARLARGVALRASIQSDTYPTDRYGDVQLVDAATTWDADAGTAAVFLVNRSLTDAITVQVALPDAALNTVTASHTIADPDRYAANTLQDPERVTPTVNSTATITARTLTIELPPVSWTAVEVA